MFSGFTFIYPLTSRAQKLRDFLLDLIFPIECIGCKKEGKWLCQKCFSNLKLNKTQSCPHCKQANDNGNFCIKCQEGYFFDSLLIAGSYNEEIISKHLNMKEIF